MKLKEKIEAVRLRKLGYSYNEIRAIIPNVSKGTLSGWFQAENFSDEERARIFFRAKSNAERGRIKVGEILHKRKLVRIDSYIRKAKMEFEQLSKEPLFISGLALYWAEGSKTMENFQFMNSDPAIIKIMLQWLQLVGAEPTKIRYSLYTHRIFANDFHESYWSSVLNIPLTRMSKTVYKPTPHTVKKNPDYRGCLRLTCSGRELGYKIIEWKKCLVRMLGGNPDLVLCGVKWIHEPS